MLGKSLRLPDISNYERVSKLAPEEAELTTKSGAACTKTGKINHFRLLAERIL